MLVALGHLTNGQGENVWLPALADLHVALYLFHMPLFFLLGGLVLHVGEKKFENFVVRRLQTLVVPYYVFSIYYLAKPVALAAFPGLAGQFSYQSGEALAEAAWSILFMGEGLWFLWAYFWGELITFLLVRAMAHLKKAQRTLACLCIGVTFIFCEQLWWSIGPAFSLPLQLISGLGAAGYLLIGVALRDFLLQLSRCVCLVCGGITSVAFYMLSNVQIALTTVSPEVVSVSLFGVAPLDALMAIATALIGSLAVIFIAQALDSCSPFEFVGKHSIVFYALSAPAMNLCKLVLFVLIGIDVTMASVATQFICGLSLAVASVVLIWPLDLFVQRFLPWSVGNSHRT
jgi:fucose 4-O-acetylase-like acetyltransferase